MDFQAASIPAWAFLRSLCNKSHEQHRSRGELVDEDREEQRKTNKQNAKASSLCIWPSSLLSHCVATSPLLSLGSLEAWLTSFHPASLLALEAPPIAPALSPDTAPGENSSLLGFWLRWAKRGKNMKLLSDLDGGRTSSMWTTGHSSSQFGSAQFLLSHDSISFFFWKTLQKLSRFFFFFLTNGNSKNLATSWDQVIPCTSKNLCKSTSYCFFF